jgi:hypothetical protein
MTYHRVIPRDLFNEASLLKCLGRLWILLDQRRDLSARLGAIEDPAGTEHTGEAFAIDQSPEDGSIYVRNLPFRVRGEIFSLSRPLNSREPWPLYCESLCGEVCMEVFTDGGDLSPEFLEFVK